eukprot:272579-Prymnesium_polylepis.1
MSELRKLTTAIDFMLRNAATSIGKHSVTNAAGVRAETRIVSMGCARRAAGRVCVLRRPGRAPPWPQRECCLHAAAVLLPTSGGGAQSEAATWSTNTHTRPAMHRPFRRA